MLSNLGRLVIIYSVAGIIGSSFSKAFTKQNIEKRFHATEFVHEMEIFLMQINS
jgi:ABC-type branched-subunit amino acid transport system substrate-binding protein